ncbi:hypothetical protein NKI04_32525 [Mesorhizobium sp. M0814]|uniref:hypothetical protein n=1 Tax=unclassified Mesorhizobium TaxID=325217 RepID=UPI003339709F
MQEGHLHRQIAAPVIDTLRNFRRDQRLPWLTLCRPAIYLTAIFFNDLSSQSNPKKRRVLIRSI